MQYRVVAALVVLLQFTSALVPLLETETETVIPGQYIFVFNKNTNEQQRDAYMVSVTKSMKGNTHGYNVIDRYDIGTFHGFAAKLSPDMLAYHLQQEDMFSYVAADQVVHAYDSCVTQNGATWGLDRIDQVHADLEGIYTYSSSSGSGVDAYIVDTGISIHHTDFGGRASWGVNYADTTNDDCNGHGTHVAGTVGGTTYGVAKATKLIAVKVLGCSGSGSWAGVISGVQWVAAQHTSTKRPSVANMSLGGGLYAALNDAVTAAVASGVTFAVAAGNNNYDACFYSPASTPTAISVGATSYIANANGDEDARSYFSNYGTCVDILAPGDLITSAWIGSNTAIRTISGTSMASPHVCGVAAMYLGKNPTATTDDVKNFITQNANLNQIDMVCGTNTVCQSTPNALLFEKC